MLRPVAFSRYCAALQALGHDVSRLNEGTDIEIPRLREAAYLISATDHERFLRNMIDVAGDDGLGLQLGLSHDITHFGVLAYAGLACETIRHGTEHIWSRFGAACGMLTRLSITDNGDHGDTSTIRMSAPPLSAAVYRFGVEESIGILKKIGQAISGQATTFSALRFAFAKPRYHARYAELFGCRPQFESQYTEVVLNREWIDTPLITRDPELRMACSAQLERQCARQDVAGSMSQQLRHYLLTTMSESPSIQDAANHFRMSSRSLARVLRFERSSFRLVMEQLRMDIAKSWVSSGDMRAKEMCFRLGFQNVGAFRRAFKHWTGRTVREFSRYRVANDAMSSPGSPQL